MRKQLALLSVVALTMLSVAAGASAHSTANGPSTWHVQTGVASEDMARMGMAFYPNDITVRRGDVVVFTNVLEEPHTVTFGGPNDLYVDPFLFFAPYGGTVYTGAPLNSGFIGIGLPFGNTLTLTIDVAPGTYAYRCMLHPLMLGSIAVISDNEPLPFTDAQYQRTAFARETVDLAHAREIATASAVAARLASDIGGTGNEVAIGGGDGVSTVMRFSPGTLTIHVGDSVTFVNRDPFTPHTVTFGPEPAGAPQSLFAPYGNPSSFDGTAPLNSGFLLVSLPWGTMFRVTFTAPGTFKYICGLHDTMGMKGSITVVA